MMACALSSLLLFAYWGLFTWLPNLLASPVSSGGAGMTIVKSVGFIIPMPPIIAKPMYSRPANAASRSADPTPNPPVDA